MSELSAYALRGQANYDGRWQDHQLTVLGGVEVRHAHHNSHSDRTYGYDDALLTFSNVDYITDFQLWDQLGYSQIIDTRDFTDLTDRFVSFYGNASYRYKRRYTATASFRKDASNLFGISTNQKWNPFWSAGLGWDLSREPFYRVNWLPALRFRITYGYNGNVKNDLAAVPTIQYNSPLGIKTNIPYANINSLPNPELRWERVNIFNAGLDFSLRDGYLEGSLEYYQKKSTDLLSPTPIDPTTGFSTMTLNSANLTGKGVDVKLKVRWIRGKFNWQTQAFFAYVRNKVSRYLKDITNIGGLAGFNYNITPIEGENPYALISYRWAGLDSLGNPVGYLDGKPSEDYRNITRKSTLDDLVIGGTTRPPFYGSLINSFSWKRFELSANIGYKFGFYFRRSSINYSSLFDSWQGNVDYTKRWQNTGDEKKTNIPSMIYPSDSNRDRVYNYSEATVEKGDFIRLQDVSISYNTGKIGLGRHAIKNIRISLYATNIGLLWRANKEGIDPDYGLGLPAPFSCSLGFKADF
ncbi:hypothetical protein GCM10023143_25520 [Compostibacter hankyongensis]|uniref:TonB-dependent receptor n=2 Tax=Compostibacter hankyongensis TaxID=1007089 RepID=A0ABP8G039_9BACT